ncbi:RNA polymerase sigma factor SigJ [Paractinoplanes maris]|uniref:RNA polymerase sigma factor SigJ n=1 Tax=Paractinoplanes maris TaxID=1734446 RepID=UPI0020209268|nr:RNA polymerase sigma factor SigJ [Actinoplanes maris]
MPHEVEVFERFRGRLEAIAYRLLGSAQDAEDAVQDTFLRWQAAERAEIRTPEAWLTKVLTNLCLNQLASARVRRESYVGQWLPEPVLDGDRMLGPAETAEQRESVSIAMLTLMERLTPAERAVYVLREAFGYPHGEIAEILDLSEANSQQLLRRARQHLATDRSRVEADAAATREIVEEFLAAALGGEIEPLVKLLTEDARGVADGGGEVPARGTPILGALAIARVLRGALKPDLAKRFIGGGRIAFYAAVVNGGPAALVALDDAGGERIVGVVSLELTPRGIATILIQANPAKLARLSRWWAGADRGEPLIENWS